MLESKVVDKIDELILSDEFSGNILLSEKGTIIFSKACGLSSKSFNIPNNINTKFNIASIGKIFTGTAIAQLVQNKLLDLNDTLNHFVDDSIISPNISSAIKLEHLLTHTSGLGDYFQAAYKKSYHSVFRELCDYKELLRDSELSFAPGTQWSYSNSGFVLLGFVIEKVTNISFYDYISKYVFSVAEMTDSSYVCEDEPDCNRAIGYYKEHQSDGTYTYRNNLRKPVIKGSPSGGCYSTVMDLYKFINALTGYQLLNEEYTRIVLSPKPELSSENYGYGFFINQHTFGHSGDGTGISTVLQHYKDSDKTLIILSNYSNPSANNVYEIIDEVLRAES